jgi:hypothetical protein
VKARPARRDQILASTTKRLQQARHRAQHHRRRLALPVCQWFSNSQREHANTSTMPPHRRQASLAAEATNKLIAEQALADAEDLDDEEREDTMSVDSSPLSSIKSGTPTPGSELNMGLGIQIKGRVSRLPCLSRR